MEKNTANIFWRAEGGGQDKDGVLTLIHANKQSVAPVMHLYSAGHFDGNNLPNVAKNITFNCISKQHSFIP